MRDDPIVAEVRRIRETYAQQFDNDLRKMADDLASWEREHPERVVTYPPKAPVHRESA
ncbi:MAG: hypothetical protein ACLFTT_16290 [Candidatus Hydrogenedentota bacterium]